MYAIIKSGGRQYKVSVGQTLEVNRLRVEPGAQVKFEEVLFISDADRTILGTPLVDNAMVLATATRQGRGKKIIVFRYKSKKRFRHKRGHRQELTLLTIDDIVAEGMSLVTGEPPRIKGEEVPVEEEEEVAAPTAEETTEVEPETEARAEAEVETAAPTPSEETEPPVEKKPSRRRRRTKAESTEDSESKTEE